MRYEILKQLDSNNFISGELLAKKLEVSRTAIWKHIKTLKKQGYKIESVKNKGYRLISKPDILYPEEIKNNLSTKIIGKKIFYFDTIDSTNIYAKNLLKKQTGEGTVVIAGIQKKGRGRKKRQWFSPKGGLWFSIILYPNVPPHHGMLVTMTISVSIAIALNKVLGFATVIKWPNDLLLNNKKVCGILTELDAEIDKINYCIVGIGINVNNKIDPELKDIATSLKIENKNKQVFKVELLKQILLEIDHNYIHLLNKNFNYIRNLWFSFSNIIGKKIRVNSEDGIYNGTVTGIDDSGCLMLDCSGKNMRIVSGDITYLKNSF